MFLEENHFMLRFTKLVLALACAITPIVYAQQPAAPAPPPAPAATPAGQNPAMPATGQTAAAAPAPAVSNVPMSDAVITLKGACQTKTGGAPPTGCVSSLTRAQFEKLTSALQQNDKPVPPEVKQRFAKKYAELLILADAARQLGMENDPRVLEIFNFAKTQILAQSLDQHYMEEYAHPSDQQIQDDYNQNLKKYTEVTLQRISIPINQSGPNKPKPSDEEMKAYAVKIRERWVAGEDPATLEKEVYEHAGYTTTSPDVNLGARRPGSLPPAHEKVFEMKTAEISEPFNDAAAYYIYKVLTVRQVPLSEVKSSIETSLQRQMYQDKLQQIKTAVKPEFNEAYFGPEIPEQPMGMRPGMPGRPMGPGGRPMPPPPPPAGAGAGPAAGSAPPPPASNATPPPAPPQQ